MFSSSTFKLFLYRITNEFGKYKQTISISIKILRLFELFVFDISVYLVFFIC